MHRIIDWIIAAVALGVGSLILNLILLVLKVGNLKSALFIRKVVALLKELPGEMLLSCSSRQVAALTFDGSQNRERSVPLYTGIITWRGGPRPASRVLSRANWQLKVRSAIFLLLFLPALLLSLWATLFVDWRFVGIPVLLIVHQFFPFYLWEYPAFSSMLHGD